MVFIDVGQSVEPSHPNGLEFLLRDCTNMSGFFERAGVPGAMTPHQLFNHVSGLKISAASDSEFIAQVREISIHILYAVHVYMYMYVICKLNVL